MDILEGNMTCSIDKRASFWIFGIDLDFSVEESDNLGGSSFSTVCVYISQRPDPMLFSLRLLTC